MDHKHKLFGSGRQTDRGIVNLDAATVTVRQNIGGQTVSMTAPAKTDHEDGLIGVLEDMSTIVGGLSASGGALRFQAQVLIEGKWHTSSTFASLGDAIHQMQREAGGTDNAETEVRVLDAEEGKAWSPRELLELTDEQVDAYGIGASPTSVMGLGGATSGERQLHA